MYRVSYITRKVEEVRDFKTEGVINYYLLNDEPCLDHTHSPYVGFYPTPEEAKKGLAEYYKDQLAKTAKIYASLT